MDDEYVKRLVITRLKAIPPNVSFSIGSFGHYSIPQLIEQVAGDTDVGRATVKMQLNFLRASAKISGQVGGAAHE